MRRRRYKPAPTDSFDDMESGAIVKPFTYLKKRKFEEILTLNQTEDGEIKDLTHEPKNEEHPAKRRCISESLNSPAHEFNEETNKELPSAPRLNFK